jgi:cytidylate kinase
MQRLIMNNIRKQLTVKNAQVWIALHGPQGCGKSTLCKNIENELYVIIYAYAIYHWMIFTIHMNN